MRPTLRQTAIGLVLAAVAISAFALGWWQQDDGRRGAAADMADSDWHPVKPLIPDLAGDAKTLAERQPFGTPATPAGSPAVPAVPGAPPVAANSVPVEWRVVGVVTTETDRYLTVLIRKPGEKSARHEIRHPGDDLPDGSVVRSIEPTAVTIDRQGTIVRIKMFAQN
jgi:hypothetical protein